MMRLCAFTVLWAFLGTSHARLDAAILREYDGDIQLGRSDIFYELGLDQPEAYQKVTSDDLVTDEKRRHHKPRSEKLTELLTANNNGAPSSGHNSGSRSGSGHSGSSRDHSNS